MTSANIRPQQNLLSGTDIGENGQDSESTWFISPSTLHRAQLFLLTYFGARLIFFALNISAFVPPDEVTHAGLCRVFAKALFFPQNSPESYQYGLVTNIPWLYYFAMGKLLHLNFFGLPDLVFLRLLNIPLAFATVHFAHKTLLLLTRDRLTRLLLLVAVTNTAMFSFLSASVSSDNLATLLATMSIYYLFAFFEYREGALLVTAVLCELAGCLTKMTLLPLAPMLALLLLIREFRRLPSFPAALGDYLRSRGWRHRIRTALTVVAFGCVLYLYLGNQLRFRTLTPAMSDLFPADIAMQYRIAARETIFRDFTEGRISYMEALSQAGGINHPGDKADTFFLLMNWQNLQANPRLWMGPLQYAKVWVQSMLGTTYGIKGHLPMFKGGSYLVPLYLLAGLALAGFAVRWRPSGCGWQPFWLAVVAGSYTLLVFYKINYTAYTHYGTPGITLQGRYLFAVLAPILVLSCHYLMQLFRSDRLRLALALSAATLFIAYDFPWFLAHATSEWYAWLPN